MIYSQREMRHTQDAYDVAREHYGLLGVDTDRALARLARISISVHCWQGDDVSGFEDPDGGLGGGIAVTGDYLGRARNADELRRDLDKAYSLIPGTHRLNLHAIYGESQGRKVERNEWQPHHFDGWIDWAKTKGHGIDFNPTCFSHSMAASGFTLASYDQNVRKFWVEHCIACRKIGEHIGQALGNPCVTNIWIPDGFKDAPVDRKRPRELLGESLDEILAERIDARYNLDSVESKLFGLGSESYVVGSYDFYFGYAIAHNILLCLDSGHFHPTETIADKLSSVLIYLDSLLLHVSRGVRWDSDHVVTFSDDLQAITQEVVRGDYIDRVHVGLDFFDASINRVAAWVIGARNTLKALLMALLEPIDEMRKLEINGDYTKRLALLEELKGMPFGAVWDRHCLMQDVPVGLGFMDELRSYEDNVLAERV